MIMKEKCIYYGLLVLAILSAVVGYLLITRDIFSPINPLSLFGQISQYVVIFDAVITIPLGLWLQHKGYTSLGLILASNAMIPAFLLFYLLGANMPMLYLAGMSAIAWYFARPQ